MAEELALWERALVGRGQALTWRGERRPRKYKRRRTGWAGRGERPLANETFAGTVTRLLARYGIVAAQSVNERGVTELRCVDGAGYRHVFVVEIEDPAAPFAFTPAGTPVAPSDVANFLRRKVGR